MKPILISTKWMASSPTPANIEGTNAYHVVTMDGADSSTVMDGFYITAGAATGGTSPQDRGAGMYNKNSSNPQLSNITFIGNTAKYDGGGMYNDTSSPTLTNVAFISNDAGSGGGMSNEDGHPTLTNVAFIGNSAYEGGGLSNGWDAGNGPLTNVLFSGNSATNGGGMAVSFSSSNSSTLTNVTFAGNNATQNGGAMYNHEGSPSIQNSIFWGNTAAVSGTQIYYVGWDNTTQITATLIQGSGGSDNWDSYLGVDNGNNLDVDPKFVNPIDAANAPTTEGDYRLGYNSPALDAGDNTLIPTGVTTDLDGNSRIYNSMVDLGAYEAQTDLIPPVVTVDTLSTSDTTPPLSGTVDDVAATVQITVADTMYEPANNGDGTWTLADDTISPALDAGTYDIEATATDASSNVGYDTTSGELTITSTPTDDDPPTITVDPLSTSDTTPPLSGTVDDVAATVQITVSGMTHTANNNGDGTWILADDTILAPLVEGTYDIEATATDASSNVGYDTTSDELTISTTPIADSGVISGTVRDNCGTPLESETVYAIKVDNSDTGMDTTDFNGLYTITGLSAGIYEVRSPSLPDTDPVTVTLQTNGLAIAQHH